MSYVVAKDRCMSENLKNFLVCKFHTGTVVSPSLLSQTGWPPIVDQLYFISGGRLLQLQQEGAPYRVDVDRFHTEKVLYKILKYKLKVKGLQARVKTGRWPWTGYGCSPYTQKKVMLSRLVKLCAKRHIKRDTYNLITYFEASEHFATDLDSVWWYLYRMAVLQVAYHDRKQAKPSVRDTAVYAGLVRRGSWTLSQQSPYHHVSFSLPLLRKLIRGS